MKGKTSRGKGCSALINEDRAIRWRTPGKRIGRFARRAATELYPNPRPARRIVRRHNLSSGGLDMEAENPAHKRNVGKMVCHHQPADWDSCEGTSANVIRLVRKGE